MSSPNNNIPAVAEPDSESENSEHGLGVHEPDMPEPPPGIMENPIDSESESQESSDGNFPPFFVLI